MHMQSSAAVKKQEVDYMSVCCVPVNNITPALSDAPALSQLSHLAEISIVPVLYECNSSHKATDTCGRKT